MARLTEKQLQVVDKKAYDSINSVKNSIRLKITELEEERNTIKKEASERHSKAKVTRVKKFIKNLTKKQMIDKLLSTLDNCHNIGGAYNPEGVLRISELEGFQELVNPCVEYKEKEEKRLEAIRVEIHELNEKLADCGKMFEDFMDEVILEGNADLVQKLKDFDNLCKFARI